MRKHFSVVLGIVAAAGYGCAVETNGDEVAESQGARLSDVEKSASRGTAAFHDRKLVGLGGNGRACSDCHVDKDAFQLKPSTVEARYQALQQKRLTDPTADDPLFRPIDADDFRINGNAASDYSELRQNGLVRITFNLPPNVKLVGRDGNVTPETFVDVWRSVPSVLNVKITGPDGQNPTWPRGPNPQGGYQLDARVDTLQNQALGAFFSHAQVQTAPASTMLDDIAHYEQTLFSSDAVKSLSKAMDNGVSPLPDIDGALTDEELAGKAVFNRSCTICHGGPGTSTSTMVNPPVRYHFIFSGCARPVDQLQPPRWQFKACPPRLARNIRMYEITLPSGVVIRRPSSDPGRFLLTGVTAPPLSVPPFMDDWEKFDSPPLRGIKNTAPYFTNNSADTLEDVVDHYEQFWKFVQAQLPTTAPLFFQADGTPRSFSATEKPALLAYLRKL